MSILSSLIKIKVITGDHPATATGVGVATYVGSLVVFNCLTTKVPTTIAAAGNSAVVKILMYNVGVPMIVKVMIPIAMVSGLLIAF